MMSDLENTHPQISYLMQVYKSFRQAFLDEFVLHLGYSSAALSFYTIIAIIPLFLVITAIFSFFSLESLSIFKSILTVMPIAINTEQIINKFSPLLHQQRNTYFVISLILTYYFASNLFLAIEYSLREIFHQELIVIKKRIFTKIIALPIFILFLFIIYFGGIFIYQIIKWLLKLPAVFQIIPKIFLLLSLNIAIIITFVTFFLLLFLVYHFIAPRRNKSLKNTIWATAIVGFFYTLLKVFFGNFITMISYINPIYGSFGSILIFLTWLFLTYNLVLIGARAIYYLELPDFKENLIA